MTRKTAQSPLIIVKGYFPRLDSRVCADIGMHARIPTQGKLGRVTVLGDDLRVGLGDELGSKDTTDGELESDSERLLLRYVLETTARPEKTTESTVVVLVP